MDSNNYIIVHAGQSQRQLWQDNIFVPHPSSTTFPHFTTSDGGGSGWQTAALNKSKCPTCTWNNNAIVNPSASDQTAQYPNSFLVAANQSVTSLNFTDYANRNFRIAAGDYAAGGANDAMDGRALGADQDEIEALTGMLGADVESGIPEFARRSNLILVPGTDEATLTYTPGTSATCAIKVWDNLAYSGTPVVDTDDSGATLRSNRRVNLLTGLTTATNYYGKLICGTGGGDGIVILRFRTR